MKLLCKILCIAMLMTMLAAPVEAAQPLTSTVMFYCCGSDLESEYMCATVNIAQMLEADLGENVTITLGVGGCENWANPYFTDGGFDIWSIAAYPGQEDAWDDLPVFYETDNAGYDIPGRSGHWSVPPIGLIPEAELGERDTTDPQTLREFIEYSRDTYPADRYFLILWDHGGGPVGGFGVDENYPYGTLSVAEVEQAIAESNMYFDFIGFDACLMGSWEIALTLSDCADYLIASEETIPAWGWNETGWLEMLSENPNAPTEALGQKIVDDFIDSSQLTSQNATLSVVNLTELRSGPLSALDIFSLDMDKMLEEGEFSRLSQARAGAKHFSSESRHLVDMIDLVERVGGEAADALVSELEEVIVYNRTTSGVDSANGLTLYFPYNDADAVDSMIELYDDLGLAEEWSRTVSDFSAAMLSGNRSVSHETMEATHSWFSSFAADHQPSPSSGQASIWDFLPGGASGQADTQLTGDTLIVDEKNGDWVLSLSQEDWDQITNVEMHIYLDDEEGYIALGRDDVVEYNSDGDLLIQYDYTWVALDGSLATFYSGPYTEQSDGYFRYTGYVPCYINDVQQELWLAWDSEHDGGYVMGYCDPTDDTELHRGMHPLANGDVIKPICAYYDYSFNYDSDYLFGSAITVQGDLDVTYEEVPQSYDAVVMYELTDVFGNSYLTEKISYTY